MPAPLFGLFTCLLTFLALGSHARAQPDAAWVARMDALAGALGELLPDVLAADATPDPRREERIRKNARALSSLAHDLTRTEAKKLPDADPTVPLLARELKNALADVRRAEARGGEHLRDSAFLVAATCIACHTRTDAGAPRPHLALPPVDPSLPQWLQADVLAATRRIEPARAKYRAVVRDEELAAAEPTLWERAVKRALVLEVRVSRDPKSALALAEQVLTTPAGEPLWEDAAGWKRSLRVWMKEGPRPTSAQGLYAHAQRLMDQAASQRGVPSDGSTDVLFLRATATLHELLARSPPADMRAQALAWLGTAYEALRDIDVWSLYLLYYEACIDAAPRSAISYECFEKLERGLLEEYSGNSGQPLPDDIAARVSRLRPLATPTKPSPSSSGPRSKSL
jgi:hypothetical protein